MSSPEPDLKIPEERKIDIDDWAANYSISQLIGYLKGAYRNRDYDKVEMILTVREKEMRSEIERLRMEAERREVKLRGLEKELRRVVRGLSEEIGVVREEERKAEEIIEEMEKRNEELTKQMGEWWERMDDMGDVYGANAKQRNVGSEGGGSGGQADGSSVGGKIGNLGTEACWYDKWREWMDDKGEVYGGNVKRRNFGSEGGGRADGSSVGGRRIGNFGREGAPYSFENSATDVREAVPRMSQAPFQQGDESGIGCSTSVDIVKRTSHRIPVRRTRRDPQLPPPSIKETWVELSD